MLIMWDPSLCNRRTALSALHATLDKVQMRPSGNLVSKSAEIRNGKREMFPAAASVSLLSWSVCQGFQGESFKASVSPCPLS